MRSRLLRSGGAALALCLLLLAGCGGPKIKKVGGVYYPDPGSFFANPKAFQSREVCLESVGVIEVGQVTPLVFKQSGADPLLYVTDIRNLGKGLVPGDTVSIVFYCGEGNLTSGNILKFIARR